MIGLIACSARKRSTAAPARALYNSPLFQKSLAYTEARCEHVYILSALHHLVPLEQFLAPYDRRLGTTKRERRIWGLITTTMLKAQHGRTSHDLLILAGQDYVDAMTQHIASWWPESTWRAHVHLPLEGLQVGERLRWLNAQLLPAPEVL